MAYPAHRATLAEGMAAVSTGIHIARVLVHTFILNRQEIEAVGTAGSYLLDARYCEPLASAATDGGRHSSGQNLNRRSA